MDKEAAYNIAYRYVTYLKQNEYNIVKAVLFGSYAKGNFNKDSDIDLAVVFNELEDSFSTQVKLLMLTRKFDTRLEPHPMSEDDFNSSNPLVEEIIKYGIEIK